MKEVPVLVTLHVYDVVVKTRVDPHAQLPVAEGADNRPAAGSAEVDGKEVVLSHVLCACR